MDEIEVAHVLRSQVKQDPLPVDAPYTMVCAAEMIDRLRVNNDTLAARAAAAQVAHAEQLAELAARLHTISVDLIGLPFIAKQALDALVVELNDKAGAV